MLSLSSSLTEIYAHFLALKSGQASVKTSTVEDILVGLENNAVDGNQKFLLQLSLFEQRLLDFLNIRKAICRTYEVLEQVEKSPNKLLSLYKMEIELVLEQFATAFYMQINSKIGDNRKPITDVRGVYQMLNQDLKELRMEIQKQCATKNSHSGFIHSKGRQNVHLERASS